MAKKKEYDEQEIADNITSYVMGYFFGDRFHDCDNLEDDYEMNHAWESINEAVFEQLNKI